MLAKVAGPPSGTDAVVCLVQVQACGIVLTNMADAVVDTGTTVLAAPAIQARTGERVPVILAVRIGWAAVHVANRVAVAPGSEILGSDADTHRRWVTLAQWYHDLVKGQIA